MGSKPDIESTQCNLKYKSVVDNSQDTNVLSFSVFHVFFFFLYLSQIKHEYLNVD